jgi:glycosyltransferase involved in cell wall biosynthesis
MAVKKLKNSAIEIINKVPGVRSYLDEKVVMAKKIERLQNQIVRMKQEMPPKPEVIKKNRTPKIKFIAHQLDNSGAPQVLIDTVREFVNTHPKAPIEFHTFPAVDKQNLDALKQLGITAMIHQDRDIDFNFTKGDVVVLNTMNHSYKFKQELFKATKNQVVKKIIWCVHEDDPSFWITQEAEVKIIQNLLKKDLLSFYIPAIIARDNFRKFFGLTKNIKLQPNKFNIPEKFTQQRKPENFDNLKFILTGIPYDARKGHLPVFYAFLMFKKMYYDKTPDNYRNFELRFVGLIDNMMSKQVKNQAANLKQHFRYYPPLKHDETLAVINESNFTVCYSLSECLPIFVFEGMAAGHPIIRNQVSGFQEQLEEGKNGYYADENDFFKLVEVLEKVLNKNKTTNEELAKMSRVSFNKAMLQAEVSYQGSINDIWSSFVKTKTPKKKIQK